MRILITMLWMFISATSATAEYFNQRNIVDTCGRDSSFGSDCYIYLAAYSDLMAFMLRATDAERARATTCILSLKTEQVAERLAQAKPLSTGYKVPELIIDELCN